MFEAFEPRQRAHTIRSGSGATSGAIPTTGDAISAAAACCVLVSKLMPHSEQKRLSAGFWDPHWGQLDVRAPSPPRGEKSKSGAGGRERM
jgi:hypothetical protein